MVRKCRGLKSTEDEQCQGHEAKREYQPQGKKDVRGLALRLALNAKPWWQGQ